MIFQQNQLLIVNQVFQYGEICRAVYKFTENPNRTKYKHFLFQYVGKREKILRNRHGMGCWGV
jgi:hypothetical protein